MNPIHSAILAALSHRSLPPLAEAYRKLKTSLESALGPDSEIFDILDVLEKRPQSSRFQAALLEELETCGAWKTPDILQTAQDLLEALRQQSAKAGTATIDIEHVDAAGVHIKNVLAEGANALVRAKAVKAKKNVVVNGLSARSDSFQSGRTGASSVAQGIEAGRDVNLTQNTTTYVGGKPQLDPKVLLRSYLQQLFALTRQLYLTGIDRKAAVTSRRPAWIWGRSISPSIRWQSSGKKDLWGLARCVTLSKAKNRPGGVRRWSSLTNTSIWCCWGSRAAVKAPSPILSPCVWPESC